MEEGSGVLERMNREGAAGLGLVPCVNEVQCIFVWGLEGGEFEEGFVLLGVDCLGAFDLDQIGAVELWVDAIDFVALVIAVEIEVG